MSLARMLRMLMRLLLGRRSSMFPRTRGMGRLPRTADKPQSTVPHGTASGKGAKQRKRSK